MRAMLQYISVYLSLDCNAKIREGSLYIGTANEFTTLYDFFMQLFRRNLEARGAINNVFEKKKKQE